MIGTVEGGERDAQKREYPHRLTYPEAGCKQTPFTHRASQFFTLDRVRRILEQGGVWFTEVTPWTRLPSGIC